jgi:hypothetical protein
MPYEFSSFTSKPFFLTNFIIKVIFITFSSLWVLHTSLIKKSYKITFRLTIHFQLGTIEKSNAELAGYFELSDIGKEEKKLQG